jgi:hypothetical protein
MVEVELNAIESVIRRNQSLTSITIRGYYADDQHNRLTTALKTNYSLLDLSIWGAYCFKLHAAFQPASTDMSSCLFVQD